MRGKYEPYEPFMPGVPLSIWRDGKIISHRYQRIVSSYTKPICSKGQHADIPENVYIVPKSGNRQCRACINIRNREFRARHKKEGSTLSK